MEILVDDYKIHYTITGDGAKNVVILQGWGTKLETYDSIATCLAPAYRVIQLDLPGFGSSDEPKEAWNVEAFTNFFIRFLSVLDIKKTSLIGHSYGGRIMIHLASRDALPFEMERFVLIDSAGILPMKTAKQKMRIKWFRFMKKLTSLKLIHAMFPTVIDDWKNRQGSADYRNASPMMKKCLVMAVNEDLTDCLSKIRQDTLLIWGDLDTATPIADAKKMEQLIPSAGLVTLKGSGHYSFLEQPALFSAVIKNYFEIKA